MGRYRPSQSFEAGQPFEAGRYVVLRHHLPADQQDALRRGDHYDWMFEVQGRLLTWASEQFPPPGHAAAVGATLLTPHRLSYLDYEGAISGDRGTVRRIEAGHHRLLQCLADRYEFAVQGERCGVVAIYRNLSGLSSGSWVIAFEPKREDFPIRAETS